VVITDPSEYRRELANKMGVTLALDVAKTPLAEAMRDLGMKEGFDVGFEMSGKAAAMRSMLETMCHGGRIAMLGLPSEDFGIDWAHLVTNMITVKGIYGREMFETWYWMSVFVQSGLDISPVVTHRYAAEDYEAAFAVVGAAECGKVVLSWGEPGGAAGPTRHSPS
jgi:threonine 3-dehydrogenase